MDVATTPTEGTKPRLDPTLGSVAHGRGTVAGKLLMESTFDSSAVGEVPGDGGLKNPSPLWYSPETAVEAILGALKVGKGRAPSV